MEAGKFLGFLLTERGIEENPEKCIAILAIRSPISVKEVQQVFKEEQQVHLDQGVRGGVPQAEGVPSQSPSVVQATAGYSAPPVLRSDRTGDQFGPCAGAGPSAEAYILCEQSIART